MNPSLPSNTETYCDKVLADTRFEGMTRRPAAERKNGGIC